MNPFDKARYGELLKGLEISEVRLSEVRSADASFRIDSEFFKPSDIANLKLVESWPHSILGNIVRKIDVGFVGAMADEYTDDKSEPTLLQTRNIQEFIVDDSDVVHINRKFHECLRKSQIHKGDILIARSGSFGNAAVWLKSGIVNSSDIIIVESDTSRIDACYLVAMLNSRFGRFQLERFASGAVQGHVNLAILENLKIPVFGWDFQVRVAKLVTAAYKCFEESKTEFGDAERKLLAELGLSGWTPTDEAISVKHYSDFVSAERFDAEYFQPKYDAIESKIRGYRGGTVMASDALVAGLVNEEADTSERYVELADIGASGEISGCTSATFGELPSRARQRMETGQVIVSSIEGSLDKCALVTPEFDKALCSTGFHRFRSTAINAETLLLLFKSWPIQQLMKRGCSGTILSAILPGELSRVPLPLVDSETQRNLASKVQSSFALRAESKRLLDLAKRAVETAIEQGEEMAIATIECEAH